MTCIIALSQDDQIFFGSDSSCSSDDAISNMRAPKIFKKGDELVGFCGDIRIGQTLRSGWSFPNKGNMALEKYIHIAIPKSMRTLFHNCGCLRSVEEVESMDANILFTYKKQIYIMEENFAIWQSGANYSSIGSGSDYALGSLFSTEEWEVHGKKRLQMALESSAQYCQSVSGPFNYLQKDV